MEKENFSSSQTQYLSAFDGPALNSLTEKLPWIRLAPPSHANIASLSHESNGMEMPAKAMCFEIALNCRHRLWVFMYYLQMFDCVRGMAWFANIFAPLGFQTDFLCVLCQPRHEYSSESSTDFSVSSSRRINLIQQRMPQVMHAMRRPMSYVGIKFDSSVVLAVLVDETVAGVVSTNNVFDPWVGPMRDAHMHKLI